jgi:hypothetical protein
MLFVGSLGATLITLTILDKKGYSINKDAVKLTMETAKYGLVLYLLYVVFKAFL